MDKISIAVISDLHCMLTPTNDDKRETWLYSDAPLTPATKHPIQALKALIKKESLLCDYVICAGDIANKECLQGIISGYAFVESIKTELKAKRSFYAPGNHDANYDTGSFEQLKSRLENFPICPLCEEDKNLIDSFWAKGYCIYTENNIAVLIINSLHSRTTTERAAKYQISDCTLESVTQAMSSLSGQYTCKIAISHHHPRRISNIDSTEFPDDSVIENGDKLIDILNKNRFSIYIHGHKHMPQLFIADSLPILSAGSFSGLENILESADSNRFHIIDINFDQDVCKGIIRSWSYNAIKGWIVDKNDLALPARTGFGSEKSVSDIVDGVAKYMANKDRCLFGKLISQFPDIVHLPPVQQIELQKQIMEKHRIEFQPSLGCGAMHVLKQIED